MTAERPDPDSDWDDTMVTDPDSVLQAKPGSHREPPARKRAVEPDDPAVGTEDDAPSDASSPDS